jgi:hypothetical protein
VSPTLLSPLLSATPILFFILSLALIMLFLLVAYIFITLLYHTVVSSPHSTLLIDALLITTVLSSIPFVSAHAVHTCVLAWHYKPQTRLMMLLSPTRACLLIHITVLVYFVATILRSSAQAPNLVINQSPASSTLDLATPTSSNLKGKCALGSFLFSFGD